MVCVCHTHTHTCRTQSPGHSPEKLLPGGPRSTSSLVWINNNRRWLLPFILLLVVAGTLMVTLTEYTETACTIIGTTTTSNDSRAPAVTVVHELETKDQTASLGIKNCVPSSSGPLRTRASAFWTDQNVQHMNVTKRAVVAVNLMYEYGALTERDTSKSNNNNNNNSTRSGQGRIVDLGSGLLALRDALPESERHRYLPVDLKERVPGSGTVICNLNEFEFPMLVDDVGVAAFTFLGSFEYILDKVTLLRLCRMHPGAHVVMVRGGLLPTLFCSV
jgi:hypothetical protein